MLSPASISIISMLISVAKFGKNLGKHNSLVCSSVKIKIEE